MDNAFDQLFSGRNKPDSIFTAGDRITTVCLAHFRTAKKKYQDVGITGFTNTNLADLFSPSLTTIRQPAFEIGQVATELLIEMIESKRPVTKFETRMLDTELIIRESTKKV